MPPSAGRHREWDHWSRTVVSEPVEGRGPDAFRFEIPGVVAIDEATLTVTLPGVEATVELTGAPMRYFPSPTRRPAPSWAHYQSCPASRATGSSTRSGHPPPTPGGTAMAPGRAPGLLYAERGWSVRQAHGFCYLVAVSDAAKVVLTCGMPDDDHEVWAGRVVTAEHDLTFLPFAGDTAVSSTVASDEGRAEIRLTQGPIEVRVASAAHLSDFYDQITPSLTVFDAEHPVAKTMDARFTLEVLVDGGRSELHDLPQADPRVRRRPLPHRAWRRSPSARRTATPTEAPQASRPTTAIARATSPATTLTR